MPRKTKEQKELELNNEEKKTTSKKTTSATKKTGSTTKAASTGTKKASTSTAKKNSTTKSATKKSASTKSKSTAAKKTSTTKKSTSSAAKKKTSTSKKAASSKTTSKKATKTTKTTKKGTRTSKTKKEKIEIVEYYDLPYRYNQTVVKVLAQTPTNLFIYWDIADKDRKNFEEKYGKDFFEKTRPVLIVYNDTIGYSFEVEINDFANSWYLNVADSKCDYRVELGRKPIEYTPEIPDNYVYISTSNEIESPNDHILFNKEQQMVYFRNVKTGEQTSKPITSMSFIRNMGKIYNIYDIYKAIYENEDIENIYNLSNPSSGNPSSRKFFFKILGIKRTFGISPEVLFIV